MAKSTVSILLINTPTEIHQEIVNLNLRQVELETGFLNKFSQLTGALRNKSWDVIIVNIDDSEIEVHKLLRSLHRRKHPSRVIGVHGNISLNIKKDLLFAGLHQCVAVNDLLVFKSVLRQQIADAVLIQRKKELEYDLNYKSQFIAKISHEMRTTLNSVILLSEILAENRNQSLNPDEIEYIDLIHGSSNNLLDLLNKILDLSKIQSGKMDIRLEKVNVADFCVRLRRLYIPVAGEKNIEFKFENSVGEHLEINSDRIRLEQVLNNLISNAIKFTNKGSVTLSTYIPEENELLLQQMPTNEQFVAFEVSDTGIGIDEEKLHAVFDSYVQAEGTKTQKQYGGTGLGLAISKEIAQLMGGKLTLESTLGKGSAFTLYLPIDSTFALSNKPDVEVLKIVQNNGPDTKKIDKPKKQKSSGCVLLVDNSTIHNMALKEFLSTVVKDCITAESAQEAYELLKTDQHFDCIILDMYLPDAYGKDVLHKIRKMETRKEVPVIIYSGKTISKVEQKELYQEALAVVQKNVNSYKVLLGHISDILEKA